MTLSMVSISLYNIIDTLFVAGINANALTAIGIFPPVYMLIISIGQGLSTGMISIMSIT